MKVRVEVGVLVHWREGSSVGACDRVFRVGRRGHVVKGRA